MDELVCYKILGEQDYRAFRDGGRFDGVPVDLRDGFIHLSFAHQLRETTRKHFSGRDDLWLITVDGGCLGDALRLEPSRGGDLFPHLYAVLPWSAVRDARPIPLDEGGHRLPPHIP